MGMLGAAEAVTAATCRAASSRCHRAHTARALIAETAVPPPPTGVLRAARPLAPIRHVAVTPGRHWASPALLR